MPFLREIITKVNEHLASKALNDKRFLNTRYEPIAKLVVRDNQTFPASVTSNNTLKDVTLDNSLPCIIYHRILSNSYAKSKTNDRNMACRTEVKMVVYGNKINLSDYELEAAITMNFPSQIDKGALKVDAIQVTLIGSDLDSQKVFNEEYKGIESRISEEDILFSIRYTIDAQFVSGCYSICACEDEPTPLPCNNEDFGYWFYCGEPAEAEGTMFTFDLVNARVGNVIRLIDFDNENILIDFDIINQNQPIGIRSYPNVPAVFCTYGGDASPKIYGSDNLEVINIQTATFAGGFPDAMVLSNFSGSLPQNINYFKIQAYSIDNIDWILTELDNNGVEDGALIISLVVPATGYNNTLVNNLIAKNWTISISV